jgi:hypothetical protein
MISLVDFEEKHAEGFAPREFGIEVGLIAGDVAKTMIAPEGVCAIFFAVPVTHGVFEVGAFVSDLALKYKKTFHRFATDLVKTFSGLDGIHRLQATVDASQPALSAWMESLGFSREGCLKSFGPSREDHYIYGRVT